METAVIESDNTTAICLKIKKDYLNDPAPDEKNLVVIYELYQCNTCYKFFHDSDKLSDHVCVAKVNENEIIEPDLNVSASDSEVNLEEENSNEKNYRYVCEICKRGFQFKVYLQIHYREHKNEIKSLDVDKSKQRYSSKLHKCPLCRKLFHIKLRLEQHVRKIHIDKALKCRVCGKEFKRMQSLKSHMILHNENKEFKCNICNESFFNKFTYKEHRKMHRAARIKKVRPKPKLPKESQESSEVKEPAVKVYACSACQETFPTKKEQGIHCRHCTEKPHKCSICGMSYNIRIRLERHHQRIHVDNVLKCHICNKEWDWKSRTNFRRHLRTHAVVKPYSCDICHKSFTEKYNLKMHKILHNDERPYMCELCGKTFKLNHLLNFHRKRAHSDTPRSRIRSGLGNSESRKGNPARRRNFENYRGNFSCDICGKLFTDERYFMNHYRLHAGESCYECEVCHKKFFKKVNLDQHKVLHGDVRHVCEVCGKCFTTKGALRSHSNIHDDTVKYECDICGKRFSTKYHLEYHGVVHTNEKPFQCDLCQRCYRNRGNLSAHRISHFPDGNIKNV